MNLEEIVELYQHVFVPAYANLVGLSVARPKQILIEESNILSHIAQANNLELTEEVRQENLVKAKNHLIRATLDLHKLVWANLRDKLDIVIKDPTKRLCFNLPEDEVLNAYRNFIDGGRKMRNVEVKHIGNNPLKSIDLYKDTNDIGLKLYQGLDINKINVVTKWTHVFKTKEWLIGFMSGIVASIIASLICN